MALIPVVTLVEVPDEVGDPKNAAEEAMRRALTGTAHGVAESGTWGVSLKLLDDSFAFCRFHAWGEINSMIRDARLLSVVAVSPRTWSQLDPPPPPLLILAAPSYAIARSFADSLDIPPRAWVFPTETRHLAGVDNAWVIILGQPVTVAIDGEIERMLAKGRLRRPEDSDLEAWAARWRAIA